MCSCYGHPDQRCIYHTTTLLIKLVLLLPSYQKLASSLPRTCRAAPQVVKSSAKPPDGAQRNGMSQSISYHIFRSAASGIMSQLIISPRKYTKITHKQKCQRCPRYQAGTTTTLSRSPRQTQGSRSLSAMLYRRVLMRLSMYGHSGMRPLGRSG